MVASCCGFRSSTRPVAFLCEFCDQTSSKSDSHTSHRVSESTPGQQSFSHSLCGPGGVTRLSGPIAIRRGIARSDARQVPDTQRHIQRTRQPTRIVRATYSLLDTRGLPTGANQSSSGSRPELNRAIPMPMPLAVRMWRGQSPFSEADPGPCEDAAARVISACHRRRC